ncbi:hypothetical protein [uncultured Parabacteroides sp.]|uniref:hypothetical protein n=1 Tax=uncultured Parabacteroides sp. TaxID=512312 RepID=UPI0026090748|nr:hypothetical protein [uncultured Parabacteroides sp.]
MDINCKYCPKSDSEGNCLIDSCPLFPIVKEIEEMQSFLETIASDNPKELIDRLTDINVYLARSGKLLADAKAYQDEVAASVYATHMEFISRVPATVAMKFVSAQSVTANQLVTWLDRINRTLVHAGDNIRTQISFAKQDMALQRKGY